MKKVALLTTVIFLLSGIAYGQTVPLPAGQQFWPYSPVSSPVRDTNPSAARPIGVGSVSSGGSTLSLRISSYRFAGPVDLYFAISLPGNPADLYMVRPDNTVQIYAGVLAPWKTSLTDPVDEAPFGDIDLSAAGIPSGIYQLYLAATPAGNFNAWYLWTTYFTVAPEPSCSAAIPVEPAAQGDYRLFQYDIGTSVGDVAIANRGWAAVAGGQDYNIYYFKRSRAAPDFTYTTGDQVNSVAISRDGRAFVAGSYDGRIYFFECDQTSPSWIYDTSQDIAAGTAMVEAVDISRDGRFVAAVSRYHVYLFRRDSATPLLKQSLTSGWLATVAISADGSHLVAGTMPEGSGARVFYLNHLGLIWAHNLQDLGWGPNDLPTPVAISADGQVMAAGGRDNRVHLWAGASSTPLWTYQIAQESPVFSVSLSDDGKRLAATGDFKLFFFDDTSSGAPTFTYDGIGGPLIRQPVIHSGHDTVPADNTYSGVGNFLHAVDISADGSYALAAEYIYNYAFSFYREFNLPLRVYHLAGGADGIQAVDLSPDGEWIMLGSVYNGEILRLEVAPAEIIEVDVPLSYNIIDDAVDDMAGLIGGDKFNVDYWIIKPGRAAVLTENWALWAMPAMGAGGVIPPGLNLCTGDKEWTYNQNLGDGNAVVSGTRQIDAPQCLESYISSIDLFFLVAGLNDAPSSRDLSEDEAILANVQVGTGSP